MECVPTYAGHWQSYFIAVQPLTDVGSSHGLINYTDTKAFVDLRKTQKFPQKASDGKISPSIIHVHCRLPGGKEEKSSILADQLRPRIWAQLRGGGSRPINTVVHMEAK